ncbi:putative quinone oxidoreductase [Aureobasidium pullulans]|nr:putative quinone oxidoreductase [Aureobasidium pullulans]
MPTPQNQAAWLNKADSPLEVRDAPLPTAGPGEIIVKNAAIAINPVDWHMQDHGIFVQQWPTILGCDVAGEVFEVGSGVDRFQKGDRVIGHSTPFPNGRPSDGAFALYTIVSADKASILPNHISFTDGVVVPFAVESAVCALSVKEPGPCMPGVITPALGLPLPTLEGHTSSIKKTLVVYGASASTGAMVTQLATAAGITVIAIIGSHNFDLAKQCGAAQVFDHKDASLVENVVAAVKKLDADFVGIFDAISIPETFERDLEILKALGGGHFAGTHPPPTENLPSNIHTGMIFAYSDITAPVYRDFVTGALQSGKLKCLPPPTIVGKGLEYVNEALKMCKAGISATKLVVEL